MTRGAVDFDECPARPGRCRCGRCAVCGYHKHMAVHGPALGAPPGSAAWDHDYVPERARLDARELKR